MKILRPTPSSFLVLWGLGALMNSISLLLFTAETGDASAWGYASGWQRDVGFGDLTWAVLVFATARKAEVSAKRFLCALLTCLSGILAWNHALAYFQTAHPPYHAFWIGMNGFAVFWGIASLWSRTRSKLPQVRANS